MLFIRKIILSYAWRHSDPQSQDVRRITFTAKMRERARTTTQRNLNKASIVSSASSRQARRAWWCRGKGRRNTSCFRTLSIAYQCALLEQSSGHPHWSQNLKNPQITKIQNMNYGTYINNKKHFDFWKCHFSIFQHFECTLVLLAYFVQ